MSETNADVVIELRRPTAWLAIAALVTGGCAAFMFERASTNDRGLVINGLIHLAPGSADVFYAVLGALCAAMAVLSVRALIALVQRKHFRVTIGEEEITLPHHALFWSSEDRTLGIDEIVMVQTAVAAGNNRFVHVDTRRGRFSLNTRWLPPEWPAEMFAAEIMRRARARFDALDEPNPD